MCLETLEDRTAPSAGFLAALPVAPVAPDYLFAFNGAAYFAGTDGVHAGLWKTDGTATGTVLINGNVGPYGDGRNSYGGFAVLGGALYFPAGTAAGRSCGRPTGPAPAPCS